MRCRGATASPISTCDVALLPLAFAAMRPTSDRQRTDWAEEFAEHFVSRPLVHECVFRSAKYQDVTVKEVCDLLLILRNQGIILQMKCQEDPRSRSDRKLERWVLKSAERALAQVRGAAKTISERGIWCEHPRRGRVGFKQGQLILLHGIVLVEHFNQRIALPAIFPLATGALPISYFTTNDFLNIIDQLRAFPEIVRYLNERYQLPEESLRGIGGEKVFFQQYILGNGSFDTWTTYSDAEQKSEEHQNEVQAAFEVKALADRDASLIEYVSDQLSQRGPDPRPDLPAALAAHVEPPETRTAYLRMQEHLCDLPLSDRRALGAKFKTVIEKLDRKKDEHDFGYLAAWVDSKPSFVFVFASSHQVARAEVLKRTWVLLRAALTHYRKTAGMAISDRDGKSFEVALIEGFVPEQVDRELADEFFGHLKTFDVPISLVPGS